MRLNRFVSLGSLPALLPVALLLTGCGANVTGLSAPGSAAIAGKSYGGQMPIVGATISVYAFGNGGYGSSPTHLGTTTTGSDGSFQFSGGNVITCPSGDPQLFMLSIGGNPGAGANPNAVLMATLGHCSTVANEEVTINEVTTVGSAFALSHFFDAFEIGNTGAHDFGAPTSNAAGLEQAVKSANAIVNMQYGQVPPEPATYKIESAKIYTIANVLASCVNSKVNGTGSQSEGASNACSQLYSFTKTPSGKVPVDTLQAAVSLALYPYGTSTPGHLMLLIPPVVAFQGGLSSAPNDWTIGVSFTANNMGLAVNPGSIPTLDIDQTGKVWFPSNAVNVGLASFDVTNTAFAGPYNQTGMVSPGQVAIDNLGYAWVSDSGSSKVSGYEVASPTAAVGSGTYSLSLPGYTSTALTIGDDSRVNVGVLAGSTSQVANVTADRSSYAVQITPNTQLNGPIETMAGEITGAEALQTTTSSTNTNEYTLTNQYPSGPTPPYTLFYNASSSALSGQVIFSGTDVVAAQPGDGSTVRDALCVYSKQHCYGLLSYPAGQKLFNGVHGLAIDGAGTLWFASAGNSAVLAAPIVNPCAGTPPCNPSPYVTGSGVNAYQYLHGTNQGGTLTTPYSVGVDTAGNVWVLNASCTTTSCIPTNGLTLTEIVGAGTPTITPVAYNITQTNTGTVGQEP